LSAGMMDWPGSRIQDDGEVSSHQAYL